MIRRFYASLAFLLLFGLILTSMMPVHGQAPLPSGDVLLGKPTGFITPAFVDLLNHGVITPAHGQVRIWSYQNGQYRPTAQVVPVDNPWPGFSFWTVQPVIIQEVGGRWTIISTTP